MDVAKTVGTIQIAKTAHEVNRVYCQSLGDFSQVRWGDAPDWQKDSAIEGVNKILQDPAIEPSDLHDFWVEHKKENGWKFGPVKDSVKLEHPCLVPYNMLPVDQQVKDALFNGVVKSFINGA